MRLVEYDAKKFLKDNKESQRKECVWNGFLFGTLEFFKQEFWLKRGEDYTTEDFVKAVYELNSQMGELKILDLLENLARFLCGYEVQLSCRKDVESMSVAQQHIYFQNQIENADSIITDKMIQDKIDFIKETLGIN